MSSVALFQGKRGLGTEATAQALADTNAWTGENRPEKASAPMRDFRAPGRAPGRLFPGDTPLPRLDTPAREWDDLGLEVFVAK